MAAWPADNVERRTVASLVPYARNARTHSEEQVAQIAASIKEWGWTTPVLVDEAGGIIAGHGRVLAARKLGIEEVPVMVATGWTEAQRRAYVLADNKLTLNGGWDTDLLKLEVAGLAELGFEMPLLGFSPDELLAIGSDKNEGLTDPNDVPEAPADPISVDGDVWIMGHHRLACGSSTDADTVEKVLNGVTPLLMVTDPPYGVNYDPEWRNVAAAKGLIGQRGRSSTVGTVSNDDRSDWSEAWALFPGDVAYVWHGALHAAEVAESLTESGFSMRSQIIWAKNNFAIGRGNYHWQHEPCWYAVRDKGKGHWAGDRKQSTLWQIPSMHKTQGKVDDGKTIHATQKPVECMKRPIENNSSPGHAVYEPFSGSGTTIIAGEMTGRSVYAIELHPAYVDMAVVRWQNFTGSTATHAETGETFAAVSASRTQAAA